MKDKDSEKILKFDDFSYEFEKDSTTEAMYKADENGEMTKQTYELYSDVYPEKFRYVVSSEETENLYEGEKVWVLKKDDEIVATFSSELSEDLIRQYVESIKSSDDNDESNDEENELI